MYQILKMLNNVNVVIDLQEQQMQIIKKEYGDKANALESICEQLKTIFTKIQNLNTEEKDIETKLNEIKEKIKTLITKAITEVEKLNKLDTTSENEAHNGIKISKNIDFSVVIFYTSIVTSIETFIMQKKLQSKTEKYKLAKIALLNTTTNKQ